MKQKTKTKQNTISRIDEYDKEREKRKCKKRKNVKN